MRFAVQCGGSRAWRLGGYYANNGEAKGKKLNMMRKDCAQASQVQCLRDYRHQVNFELVMLSPSYSV